MTRPPQPHTIASGLIAKFSDNRQIGYIQRRTCCTIARSLCETEALPSTLTRRGILQRTVSYRTFQQQSYRLLLFSPKTNKLISMSRAHGGSLPLCTLSHQTSYLAQTPPVSPSDSVTAKGKQMSCIHRPHHALDRCTLLGEKCLC